MNKAVLPRHCRSVTRTVAIGRRVAEFGELASFDQARSGRRQIVFISGEPGIGKSSLADAFLERFRQPDDQGRARPMSRPSRRWRALSALDRGLDAPGRRSDGAAVKEILPLGTELARANAGAVDAVRAQPLEARGRATRERMMRELTLAIEAIASDVPLLLKLEDIHWSDTSRSTGCPCGAPPGARPPHGDRDVPAG